MATNGRHAVASRRSTAIVAVGAGVTLRVVRAALAGVILAVVAAVGVGHLLHMGMSPVLSGSMRPTFAPGDAVVTRMVPTSSIRPGDIAVIVPPGETAPFAHRVRTVTHTARGIVVTTKGDANPAPDSWHALLDHPQVPIVVTHLPKVGYAMVAIKGRLWRAALIAALGLFLTFLAARSVLAGDRPARPRLAHGARL